MDWNQLFNDFRQKYEGCYCSIALEGCSTPQIFMLDLVEGTRDAKGQHAAPLLHFFNEDAGEIILKYGDSQSDIKFSLPRVGLFNYKDSVVMLRRAYSRQFKKGVCNGTITLKSIYGSIHNMFNSRGEDLLSEKMVKCFNVETKPITLQKGIDELKTKLAICLSHEFALGLSLNSNANYILWYYENPIGVVDPTIRRIYLRENQFKQEFQDFYSTIKGTNDFTLYG